MSTPEPFTCKVVRDAGLPFVVVRGELDLATVDVLDRTLLELRDGEATLIVLDLRGVSFTDSTGVSLILRWCRAAEAAAWDLRVCLSGPVEDVLALTGTLPQVPLHDPEHA